MKKSLCVFLVLLMLLTLGACKPAVRLYTVADDITLRQGDTLQGTIILFSGSFSCFSAESASKPGEYEIAFTLTKEGRQNLADATASAVSSGGKLSLWAGGELLYTCTIEDPVDDGYLVIILTDKERLVQICNKLRGKPILPGENSI